MTNRNTITFERAYELRDELQGYEADRRLLDGLTAADSLASVLAAEKRPEVKIVFDGADYKARLKDEEAQGVLF